MAMTLSPAARSIGCQGMGVVRCARSTDHQNEQWESFALLCSWHLAAHDDRRDVVGLVSQGSPEHQSRNAKLLVQR